ncbi:helix-turn-helix domain-containing protein [Roseateles sp. BYS78W]|uniref:Helix-turn-helix domain-containing protein n=1 Tax=Pelomonas candidula TaxID=3299025 RepID=A0ABW7H619_9BURK
MDLGKTLMDAVCAKQGWTRYRIAKELHASEGYLSRVYNGKDPISPALAVQLAELAGMDTRLAAAEALVSHEKDYTRKIALARALRVAIPPEPERSNALTVQLA